eukprot:m.81027 g.81027  ORF g.81027 m.81027 type:complete len:57 (-) comp14864_c3_seq5:553-723(-)
MVSRLSLLLALAALVAAANASWQCPQPDCRCYSGFECVEAPREREKRVETLSGRRL